MDLTRSESRPLLGAALALGLAADGLLRTPALGLNLAIFIAVLIGWSVRTVYRLDPQRPDRSGWPWVAALYFAAMWAVRDNETLLAWDTLAVLGLLGLPIIQARGRQLTTAGAIETLLGPPRTGLAVAGGLAAPLLGELRAAGDMPASRVRLLTGIAAGALLGLPLILVFGALFANADPVFGAFAASLGDLDLGPVPGHVATIVIAGWLAGGFLTATGRRRGADVGDRVPAISIGSLAVMIAMGSVVLTFTAFTAVQAGSLFRGEASLRAATGLTFAEYARSGFFELVAASVLALPVVYSAPSLAGALSEAARRSLRALQMVLLGLMSLVAASALWRMALYVGAYGLTEDRVFGSAIITWILASIGVFTRTLLAGRPERTAFGVTVAAALVLGALNAVNPGALIARYNLAHHAATIDVAHLTTLGDDAMPAIAASLEHLPAETRCAVAGRLRETRGAGAPTDWRSWNLSRNRARRLMRQVETVAAACGAR